MKQRRRWPALLTATLLAASLAAQEGRNVELATVELDERWALVVGNANYTSGKLKNPTNDARDMKEALEELGFTVEVRLDVDRRTMVEAIRGFGRRLRGGGLGLFYFAGHGVQTDGLNYLIPIGARIEKEGDIEFEAVQLRRVLNEMGEAQNGVNVVVLDACRDNPFRSFRTMGRGLAQTRAPAGTLIAYATAPGDVAADGDGRNGIFTGHLLGVLRQPGLEIEQIFKSAREAVAATTGNRQVPWTASSLMGQLVLVEGDEPEPLDEGALELALWEDVKESEDVAELRAYLHSRRAANRDALSPGDRWSDVGFRLVRMGR